MKDKIGLKKINEFKNIIWILYNEIINFNKKIKKNKIDIKNIDKIYKKLLKLIENEIENKNSISLWIVLNYLYLIEIFNEINNELEREKKSWISFETNYELWFWDNANWIIKITYTNDMYNMYFESENWYWDPNWLDVYELYIDINKSFSEQTQLINDLIKIK